MSADRRLDVVVFGATGFVGRLTAGELVRRAPDGVRVGLAGRSQERLARVRDGLGPRAAGWPLVAADSSDAGAMRALAESCRVVATTVGPYRSYGMALVEACVAAGTDYVDLTGEVLFMRAAIDRCDAVAQRSGARIVHTCGFDSIPSDLGVLLLHEAVVRDRAGELTDTTLVVRAMKGGASGGTLASLTGQLDEVRGDPALREVVEDPYALSPDRAAEPDLGRQADLRAPSYDADLDTWLAPFVMASINTRVVRRSNALQGWAYGRSLRYREAMGMGSGTAGRVKAAALAAGVGALVAGLSAGPTRRLLDRVLPAPGEGPSDQAREQGFFKIDVHTRTTTGARYVCHVAAQGDPGYKATAVMLAEAALCLLLDRDRLPDRAGVLTPATAMGTALADRLRAAGQTLEVEKR